MTALTHAKFVRLPTPDASGGGRSITVQFNPSELNFAKAARFAEIGVPGLDTPLLQYVSGLAETLELELLFDSTEDGTGTTAKPVTELTNKFYELIKADEATHAPPVLLFLWGGTAFPGARWDDGFRCVVTSVRQQFTMFAPDGKPLRAKLTVSLKEYKPLTLHLVELGFMSADHTKAAVVGQDDTLTSIAYREFADDRNWRLIAAENGIVDPLAIRPGQILRVPRGAGR